jgi:hypothetical protein
LVSNGKEFSDFIPTYTTPRTGLCSTPDIRKKKHDIGEGMSFTCAFDTRATTGPFFLGRFQGRDDPFCLRR